jgi:hypothetical protein
MKGRPAAEIYHLSPGTLLDGRYVVGMVMGFGGFGITYKAWDTKLQTVAAIKEYFPGGIVNRRPGEKNVTLFSQKRVKEYDHGIARFLDEAKNMAKFQSHPSIVNVVGYFEENQTAYIVMEFLSGVTLSAFLKTNKLDADGAADVILRVCGALTAVHSAGVVHRDVSPDNIFICADNKVKLIDFGAARFSSDDEAQMTIILKPGYAPPEQYENVNAQGDWTDIYALGATMYMMLTGVRPQESISRKANDTLRPPSALDAGIPEYISNTVMKAMALERHMRFATIAEFAKALNRQVKVVDLDKEKRTRKFRRLFSVLAAALIVAAAFSVFMLYYFEDTLPAAEITLCYRLSGDEAMDGAKHEALEAIASSFRETYKNIGIEITGIDDDLYGASLMAMAESGDIPALFESSGDAGDLLSYAGDVSGIVGRVPPDQPCRFLDQYEACYPDKKRLPLGIVVPAIYINKSVDGSEFALDQTKSVFSAKAADAYQSFYGAALLETWQAKERFIANEAAGYFSDTSDYYDIRAALPARFEMTSFPSWELPCAFGNVWSVGQRGDNERKAAERLLLFMLSENAQDLMYIQHRNTALPINDEALARFTEINNLEDFFAIIGGYTFIK